jgi:hypothetical protein
MAFLEWDSGGRRGDGFALSALSTGYGLHDRGSRRKAEEFTLLRRAANFQLLDRKGRALANCRVEFSTDRFQRSD